jgi:DNA polymerase III delta subunit
MRPGVASHLLERANGNIRLVRDLCLKLAMFPQEPTIAMVNELLREHPRDTFAGALLALDRKTALLALAELPQDEYAAVIGTLEANVDLAGLVHDMLVQHKSNSEISRAAGNKRFLVPDLLPVARHYNPTRRASIRQLLSDADEVLRLGERTAVMETLVAYW